MDNNELVLKKISKIALIALGLLLTGALIFYKERIFFADAAYILFNIINYNTLPVQDHRFGSFITQVVPYMCQKAHLPLKAVLFSYAVSFNLFYLTVALILVYKLKQYGLAILMSLYYFLFVSDSYFWISNEIHQATAWMFLLFGVTLYLGNKKANMAVTLVSFVLLAILTIFTHFIIIIPTVFIWIYLILDRKHCPFSRNISILLSSLLLIIMWLKFIDITSQAYDTHQLQGLKDVSFYEMIRWFKTPVIRMFGYKCLTNYWVSVPVFITGIAALLNSGKKLLALWVLTSTLGYLFIIGLTYKGLDEHVLLFHIESEWASIGIIIAAPFVFTFLPRIKLPVAASLLAFIFVVRLAYIGYSVPAFSWRTHFQEQVLAQMQRKGITKLALYRDPDIYHKYMLDWGAGYESLLQSAMNNDKPNRSFIFVDRDIKKETLAGLANSDYIYLWDMLPSGQLNHRYFMMDTTHTYEIMSYEQFIK